MSAKRSHCSHVLALMTGETATAPDPVLKLRTAVLGEQAGTVARRRLPEDPVLRAALRAERLLEITGQQRQTVTCWLCGQDYGEARYGEDGWTAGPDGTPVCWDRSACDSRAAEAGLVPVIGGPRDGGDVA